MKDKHGAPGKLCPIGRSRSREEAISWRSCAMRASRIIIRNRLEESSWRLTGDSVISILLIEMECRMSFQVRKGRTQ